MTETLQNAIRWDHPAACHAVIRNAETAEIDWQGRTKFGIVGFASSSRELAPYDDPSWVLCGLNQLYRMIPRADAWIDIHHDWGVPEKVVEGTDYLGWLRQAPVPIFMLETHPEIPGSIRYPVDGILHRFGRDCDYFTSTISFLIAYGIYAGFKTIGIWGVDLIAGQEWFYQKACAEHWLGMARAHGVELVIPPTSALLKTTHRYGYEPGPSWGPITLGKLEAKIKELSERKAKLIAEVQTIDGALQISSYWRNILDLSMKGGTIDLP